MSNTSKQTDLLVCIHLVGLIHDVFKYTHHTVVCIVNFLIFLPHPPCHSLHSGQLHKSTPLTRELRTALNAFREVSTRSICIMFNSQIHSVLLFCFSFYHFMCHTIDTVMHQMFFPHLVSLYYWLVRGDTWVLLLGLPVGECTIRCGKLPGLYKSQSDSVR